MRCALRQRTKSYFVFDKGSHFPNSGSFLSGRYNRVRRLKKRLCHELLRRSRLPSWSTDDPTSLLLLVLRADVVDGLQRPTPPDEAVAGCLELGGELSTAWFVEGASEKPDDILRLRVVTKGAVLPTDSHRKALDVDLREEYELGGLACCSWVRRALPACASRSCNDSAWRRAARRSSTAAAINIASKRPLGRLRSITSWMRPRRGSCATTLVPHCMYTRRLFFYQGVLRLARLRRGPVQRTSENTRALRAPGRKSRCPMG